MGLLKNINKYMRLASARFERLILLNRSGNFARPFGTTGVNRNTELVERCVSYKKQSDNNSDFI